MGKEKSDQKLDEEKTNVEVGNNILTDTDETMQNEDSEGVEEVSKEDANKEEAPKEEEEKEEEPVEMVEIPKKRLEELEVAESKALEEVRRERASSINYRKRLEKQRDEFADFASVRVLKKLLNVQDDLKRILENGKDAIQKEHYEGIDLLRQRVEGIFDQEGVTLLKIKEGKTAYDPYRHEAILSQPMENMNPNIVLTQVSAGFVKGERVVRPAKVIISKKPPKPEEEKKTKEKKEEKGENIEENGESKKDQPIDTSEKSSENSSTEKIDENNSKELENEMKEK